MCDENPWSRSFACFAAPSYRPCASLRVTRVGVEVERVEHVLAGGRRARIGSRQRGGLAWHGAEGSPARVRTARVGDSAMRATRERPASLLLRGRILALLG